MKKFGTILLAALAAMTFSADALAQAAGAGADYNRAEAQRMRETAAREAAREAEGRRQAERDPPLRPDYIMNVVTSAGATGVIRGVGEVAGTVITSSALNAAGAALSNSGSSTTSNAPSSAPSSSDTTTTSSPE